MVDIARLGIVVDTSQLKQATAETTKLTTASTGAAAALDKEAAAAHKAALENAQLATANARAGEALQREARAAAEAATAQAKLAQTTAGASTALEREAQAAHKAAVEGAKLAEANARAAAAQQREAQAAAAAAAATARLAQAEAQAAAAATRAAQAQLRLEAEMRRSTAATAANTAAVTANASALQGIQGGLMTLVGGFRMATAAVGTFMAAMAINKLIDVTTTLQRVEMTLAFVTGSVTFARGEFEEFSQAADKLGLSIEQAAPAYSSFAAAAKAAGLSTDQSRKVFTGVSSAMLALGRTSEDARRALYALQQMVSKGTVSSEELRQQLGEALPGAMQFAAQAMGMTVKEFSKAMEQGKIDATEFVVAFGDVLNTTFGGQLEAAGQTATRAMSELENAFFTLQAQIVEGGFREALIDITTAMSQFLSGETGKDVARGIGEAFEFAADNLNLLIIAGTAFIGLRFSTVLNAVTMATVNFARATVGAAVATRGMSVATGLLTVATNGLGVALRFIAANPVGLALTAIAAGYVYLTSQTDHAEEATEALAEAQGLLNESMVAQFDTLDALVEKYMEATEKMLAFEEAAVIAGKRRTAEASVEVMATAHEATAGMMDTEVQFPLGGPPEGVAVPVLSEEISAGLSTQAANDLTDAAIRFQNETDPQAILDYNEYLIDLSHTMSGPAKDALLGYIAALEPQLKQAQDIAEQTEKWRLSEEALAVVRERNANQNEASAAAAEGYKTELADLDRAIEAAAATGAAGGKGRKPQERVADINLVREAIDARIAQEEALQAELNATAQAETTTGTRAEAEARARMARQDEYHDQLIERRAELQRGLLQLPDEEEVLANISAASVARAQQDLDNAEATLALIHSAKDGLLETEEELRVAEEWRKQLLEEYPGILATIAEGDAARLAASQMLNVSTQQEIDLRERAAAAEEAWATASHDAAEEIIADSQERIDAATKTEAQLKRQALLSAGLTDVEEDRALAALNVADAYEAVEAASKEADRAAYDASVRQLEAAIAVRLALEAYLAVQQRLTAFSLGSWKDIGEAISKSIDVVGILNIDLETTKNLIADAAINANTLFQNLFNAAGTLPSAISNAASGLSGWVMDKLGILGRTMPPPPVYAPTGGGGGKSETEDEFEKAVERTRERTAEREAEAAAIGKTTRETERLKVQTELLKAAEEAGLEVTPALTAQIDELATAAGAAAQALEDANKAHDKLTDKAGEIIGFAESTRTPGEQAQAELDRLVELRAVLQDPVVLEALAEAGVTAEEALEGVTRATDDAQAAVLGLADVGEEAGSALEDAFKSAILKGEDFMVVLSNLLLKMADVAWQAGMAGPIGQKAGGWLQAGLSWAGTALGFGLGVTAPSTMAGGTGLSNVQGMGIGRASGGAVRAGDRVWVGEEGPEVVEFGTNATVHSSAASEAMTDEAEVPGIGGAGIGGQEAASVVYEGDTNVSADNSVHIDAPIHVDSGAGGTAEDRQDLAQKIGRQVKEQVNSAMDERMRHQMRPGGMFNPSRVAA